MRKAACNKVGNELRNEFSSEVGKRAAVLDNEAEGKSCGSKRNLMLSGTLQILGRY